MWTKPPHVEIPRSRREFLAKSGAGFGALALSSLLGPSIAKAAEGGSALRPHYAARAKSVIFLFMEGGPSALDTFDPKPKLNELAGKPLPPSFKPVITAMGEYNAPLLASKRAWKRHGKGGLLVSDWYPHVATCADDLAVIRSCIQDGIN